MKKIKNFLVSLITLTMLFSGITVNAFAEDDKTAPALNEIYFSDGINKIGDTEKTAGDTIKLHLDITETETGINDIWIQLLDNENGSYNSRINVNLSKNDIENLVTNKVGDHISLDIDITEKLRYGQDEKYVVQYVMLKDVQQNTSEYTSFSVDGVYMLKKDINDSNGILTPTLNFNPVNIYSNLRLKTIGYENNSVTKPDKIYVKTKLGLINGESLDSIDVKDNVEGIVQNVVVELSHTVRNVNYECYYNAKMENKYESVFNNGETKITSSEFSIDDQGNIIIPIETKNAVSGNYKIRTITLYLSNNTTLKYTINSFNSDKLQKDSTFSQYDIASPEVTLNKTDSDFDETLPKVSDIQFAKSEVTRPGVAKIKFKLNTPNDLFSFRVTLEKENALNSGVYNASERFFSYNDNAEKDDDGYYSISVRLPDNASLGTYRIFLLEVVDKNQNSSYYSTGEQSTTYKLTNAYDSNDVIDGSKLSLTLKDEQTIYATTSLSNTNLSTLLDEMPEGNTYKVIIDNDGTLKKEIFDTIKGKDKSVLFVNQSNSFGYIDSKTAIQWLFNGKDIVNATKDINLNCTISQIQNGYGTKNNTVAELVFADNGILPGKATVKFKSDYIYSQLDLDQTIHLYYIDDTQIKDEGTNFDFALGDEDKWVQIELTHNSTFVASSKAVTSTNAIQDEYKYCEDVLNSLSISSGSAPGGDFVKGDTVTIEGEIKKEFIEDNGFNYLEVNFETVNEDDFGLYSNRVEIEEKNGKYVFKASCQIEEDIAKGKYLLTGMDFYEDEDDLYPTLDISAKEDTTICINVVDENVENTNNSKSQVVNNISDISSKNVSDDDKQTLEEILNIIESDKTKEIIVNTTIDILNKDTISLTQKNSIEELIDSDKDEIQSYLDLSVLMSVDDKSVNLIQTPKPITFTFEVTSKELANNQTYIVVRYHDGKAEILPTTYNDGQVTFETDKFSTYALVLHTHSYSSNITKEAQVGVKGVRTYTCTICGHTYTEDIEAKKATTSTTVTSAVTTPVATVTTPTLSKAGDTVVADNGSTVTLLSTGAVSVKMKNISSKTVKVPSTVTVGGKTYKITTLKGDAFDGEVVKSVTLPKSITKLNAKTFAGDKKLTTIKVNSKKLTIGKNIFKGISKKQKAKIKVTVNKKNMSKKNFYKLRKALMKQGIKYKNIMRK